MTRVVLHTGGLHVIMDQQAQTLPQTYNPVKIASKSPKKYLKITAAAATITIDEVDATGTVLNANIVPSTSWVDGTKIPFSFDQSVFVIARYAADTDPMPGVSAWAGQPVS